jgi:hypothetical protein
MLAAWDSAGLQPAADVSSAGRQEGPLRSVTSPIQLISFELQQYMPIDKGFNLYFVLYIHKMIEKRTSRG